MNRIEEIRERAKNEEYVKHDIDYHEAQEDMQYILSKLEIVETALEEYAERTNWRESLHYDKVSMKRIDVHGFMDTKPVSIRRTQPCSYAKLAAACSTFAMAGNGSMSGMCRIVCLSESR